MSSRTYKSVKEAYREGTDYQFATEELQLGVLASYRLIHNPKHMCFFLSRYQFCEGGLIQ